MINFAVAWLQQQDEYLKTATYAQQHGLRLTKAASPASADKVVEKGWSAVLASGFRPLVFIALEQAGAGWSKMWHYANERHRTPWRCHNLCRHAFAAAH